MKREGRQHGMVRTKPILPELFNPRPVTRHVNKLCSPPMAGIFTKVSSKPTNHSKFTGKCGRPKCNEHHVHPPSKAKDKGKGVQKLRSSSDVVSNCRLITWRVVDAKPGLKFSGSSASDVLDQLTYPYVDDDDDDDDDDDHGRDDGVNDEVLLNDVGIEDTYEYYNDDQMSFCEVEFEWEPMDGDESWCLVEEM